ncbi:hypothetical protein F511_25351 [Dorcoceras hygrometricum]|uniref:Uncharacterized protein n=1 Tax=Dorcoceras hygrometricum TaxID=472368 RepID=A0A2Z7C236_9LAMI|nr:hypothetical protein F511_25351 [Dorcoceras hygrometricum]
MGGATAGAAAGRRCRHEFTHAARAHGRTHIGKPASHHRRAAGGAGAAQHSTISSAIAQPTVQQIARSGAMGGATSNGLRAASAQAACQQLASIVRPVMRDQRRIAAQPLRETCSSFGRSSHVQPAIACAQRARRGAAMRGGAVAFSKKNFCFDLKGYLIQLWQIISSIRSTTGYETSSSPCTRRRDEIYADGLSSSNWPETIFRRRGAAAAAACGEESGGGCD